MPNDRCNAMLLLPLVICVLISFSDSNAHECLKDDNEFACKFGTLTPYRYIANHNESHLEYPECTEKKIWMMVRHGTRYPKKKNIKAMKRYLSELQTKVVDSFKDNRSQLSAEVIKKIKDWKMPIDKSQAMNLAKEGENELIDLAERMQVRFPTLFPEDYDENIYKFKYTDTQRTEKSAKSFALGLFGQQQSKSVEFPEPEKKDRVLRFYKRCERWQIEVDDNPETYKERDLFIRSKPVQDALSDISRRIGFKLEYDVAKLVYKICGFENAWYKGSQSPWCNLLSFDDVKVFNYLDDLEYYWVDGYGFRLTSEQACPALLDMFSFFESSNSSLVTAYFTHSGSILKMLSILGIAKDENPLTHSSYESTSSHKTSRMWKVSLIDSFASNIAFVLYDCKSQGPSVLLMHQERPVQIPGCPDQKPCPLSTLKNKFPDTGDECRFEDMCAIK